MYVLKFRGGFWNGIEKQWMKKITQNGKDEFYIWSVNRKKWEKNKYSNETITFFDSKEIVGIEIDCWMNDYEKKELQIIEGDENDYKFTRGFQPG